MCLDLKDEWLLNNALVLDDILDTLRRYDDKMKKYDIYSKEFNVIWQFRSTLARNIIFFTFLRNEWDYNKNNKRVFRLTNQLLWSFLSDLTVISANIGESSPEKVCNDNYFIFMKILRNILHHQKIDDSKITLKKLFELMEMVNQEITDNSNEFLSSGILETHHNLLWKKQKNDYISICKFYFGNYKYGNPKYERISNIEKIEEEIINYRFAEFVDVNSPNIGELNSFNNFISYVFITQHYILHIKIFPILYWGIEKIVSLLF